MRITALLLAAAAALPGQAAELPQPEIDRPDAAPQAIGAAHTLRTIPEACARIQGVFTGQADDPYAFSVVRTGARCQPRAALVDAAKVKPTPAHGWIFNDLIRVPSAACPSRTAVVKVWRKPAAASEAPQLDGQGAARVYLDDAGQPATAERLAAIPQFAVAMTVEGEACGE